MADTSLNENRIGLLIWQTSNVWQSKIRKQLINFNLSFNEYLILETVYKLSKSIANISQVDVAKHSFIDKSVVSAKLTQLKNKKLIKTIVFAPFYLRILYYQCTYILTYRAAFNPNENKYIFY